MTQRRLHIAAYDIVDDRRRRAVHRIVRGLASGAQKSVYECLLSPCERDQLVRATECEMDITEDRLIVVALQTDGLRLGLGQARVSTISGFRYIG
jgi:CRISPR-associated endonuclease Cas2